MWYKLITWLSLRLIIQHFTVMKALFDTFGADNDCIWTKSIPVLSKHFPANWRSRSATVFCLCSKCSSTKLTFVLMLSARCVHRVWLRFICVSFKIILGSSVYLSLRCYWVHGELKWFQISASWTRKFPEHTLASRKYQTTTVIVAWIEIIENGRISCCYLNTYSSFTDWVLISVARLYLKGVILNRYLKGVILNRYLKGVILNSCHYILKR